MESIFVAEEVSQPDKSWLNDVAPSNMPSKVVTELTSQSEMSLLKAALLQCVEENKPDMSSTPLGRQRDRQTVGARGERDGDGRNER